MKTDKADKTNISQALEFVRQQEIVNEAQAGEIVRLKSYVRVLCRELGGMTEGGVS